MRIVTIAAALMVLSAALPAQAQLRIVSDTKPATMLRTDEIIVHSDAIGRDFILEVTRPEGEQPGRKYPAVYALDGGFGVAGPMTRVLIGGGRMEQAFIVSIGYPNPNARHFGPRETDLVHGRVTQGGRTFGGGGAAFETFLMKDIRPLIEQRYAVDPARSVLMGHSAGGLFAANIIARTPDAFAGYILGSTPTGDFDPTLLERLKAAAAKGGGRRVYLGYVADDVARLGSEKVGPALSSPGSTFVVKQEIYEGETHSSAFLPLATRGIPFVLPIPNSIRPSVTLPTETLDRLVGVYDLGGGRTVTVTRNGTRMTGLLTGGGPVELLAESPTRLFVPTLYAEIGFTMGADGKAASIVMRNNGVDTPGTRIR